MGCDWNHRNPALGTLRRSRNHTTMSIHLPYRHHACPSKEDVVFERRTRRVSWRSPQHLTTGARSFVRLIAVVALVVVQLACPVAALAATRGIITTSATAWGGVDAHENGGVFDPS